MALGFAVALEERNKIIQLKSQKIDRLDFTKITNSCSAQSRE
jgi:hypothetical protein